MTALLRFQDRIWAEKSLIREGSELWANDQYSPVGYAEFELPEPVAGMDLSLELTGGYVYSTPGGQVVPMPAQGHLTIPIRVLED
ncbi:hypothetical protein [Geoalkalibacter halelectricus]|uniref:Uncharacterized protein n=1 Tax=Geoalkalibacter halelectricus TaxID=2847045 RepID=A0ABY5ZJ74_9BACT|nr:hypothetical protein [Geoalkalibacter halelectricus]MDO3378194.1 hypothetical protein [Geoalkalibacter halelectricus]UWZ78037.1 hypothetical protein L9S41_10030 [Geoalkalibacter halelectricus]